MEADLEFMEQMLSRLVQLEPGRRIHLEPFETEWLVRLGDGQQMTELARLTHQQGVMLAQFLLKGADIFEQARKLPADGVFKLSVDDREQWLSVSSTPVVWGAKLVVGVLRTQLPVLTLPELGLDKTALSLVKALPASGKGLVVVGGRSRSGRSTTERAILAAAARAGRRTTLIGYADQGKIDGVEQIMVGGPKRPADVMPSLIESPVEVIGTYLDCREDMMPALQAASSKLVVGIMNAPGAINAVFRFLLNEVPPGAVALGLRLVLVQRLRPRLCADCRVAKPAGPAMLKSLGIDASLLDVAGLTAGSASPCFFQKAGCPRCNGKGYDGNQLLVEALNMNDELRQLVQEPTLTPEEFEVAAARHGWVSFRRRALEYALRGLIRVEDAVLD